MNENKQVSLGFAPWRVREQLIGMSHGEKKFAIYLETFEHSICTQMKEWGYSSTDLYSAIISALKAFGNQDKLSSKEVALLAIHSALIKQPLIKKYAPAAYNRFMVAGVYYTACSLSDKNVSQRLSILHDMFPQPGISGELVRSIFARFATLKEATRNTARSNANKRAEKIALSKKMVIEQWEKYTGNKSTAANFATKLSEGADDSAKPEFWRDIETGEPLTVKTYRRKKVVTWINEHRLNKTPHASKRQDCKTLL